MTDTKDGQTKARSRRMSPEASRLAALEAARALLTETGPQAVTLKAVASRIGRTHANLLHHFGSASGLQKALAEYLTRDICAKIGAAVDQVRDGTLTARGLADLIFDSFDREGAGALASWMLLSGNEDALNPIVETIHELVDDIAATSPNLIFEDGVNAAEKKGSVESPAEIKLHRLTLEMVLLALGDSLLGGQMAASLGLPASAGREIAAKRLEQSLENGLLKVDRPI